MLLYSVQHLSGTSTKTGRPYDGYALEGVTLINGQLRNDRAFVNNSAYQRNPVQEGDIAEVFKSGEIYVKAKNAFDVQLLLEALVK